MIAVISPICKSVNALCEGVQNLLFIEIRIYELAHIGTKFDLLLQLF